MASNSTGDVTILHTSRQIVHLIKAYFVRMSLAHVMDELWQLQGDMLEGHPGPHNNSSVRQLTDR